ncbi:HNH endonuclease [Pseudomonas putida]|nr:HNH endonuclease signature motif containing protein [Pseudomonas sp.]MDX3744845.1 HNH endonuclease signature motif containing protein [Pseudomonas sp.]QRI85195.1 HNH endonuclease [Pseudomonas putida]
MPNLNSFEIAAALIRKGFVLTVKNQHANGYEQPDFDGRVFVKMSKTGAPVAKQPFLIHPEHATAGKWDSIKVLSPSLPNTEYRNTNMTGYPTVAGSDSKLAIALDIATEADLHQLLDLLGYKSSVSALQSATPKSSVSTEAFLNDPNLTDTERDALIKARIGQSSYRDDLLAHWGGCAITDCCVPELLRASHIKPWRAASPAERLDPFNGLLLTPNLDLAFDRGLISFDDQGQILLGEDLDPDSARALNITPCLRLRQIKPQHRGYLAWHREHLFRK